IGRFERPVEARLPRADDGFIARSVRGERGIGRRADPRDWKCVESPQVGAVPVIWKAIVGVVRSLLLPGNRLVGINTRAIPDLLLAEAHMHDAVVPGDLAHGVWGDQHPTILEPGAGLDDHVADRPALVVEIEILDR